MTARDLVLVGGGHAHAHVLRAFGRRPEPGIRVTLVSRDRYTAYSGMLPGHVAGAYGRPESQIDMRALAQATGARFVEAEIDGLDREARTVLRGGHPVARYDLLSLDTGSRPDLSVPGASVHALAVKPVPEFLVGWGAIRAAAATAALRIVVVGGGAGGAELALAMRAALAGREHRLTLVTGTGLVPALNDRARCLVAEALDRCDVSVVVEAKVVEVGPDRVETSDGRRIGFDHLVWATWAQAPPWLRQTGLTLDARGFVAVDAALRSVNAPDVFAAGDVAGVMPHPRPKAGVFAVRQGKPLADNLRRALRGEAPRSFTPQRNALVLLGTGDGRAIAARGRLGAEGRWVWHLKRWIDRRWIARYQV